MASLMATPVANWLAACATIITESNITTGFVDQYGRPMSEYNNYTWGVNSATCYAECGKDKIYQVFNFNTFASSFTAWLLPWISLTAQLPFQSSGPYGNLTSLFLAIGSPALIIYSLTLTILNRIWVRRQFAPLYSHLDSLVNLSSCVKQNLKERLEAVQYLLQECQQVPMRASQVGGWLSSLIVLEKNDTWWAHVKESLENTRRGYSLALVAQIAMALIAYIFTIAASLSDPSSLGGSEGKPMLLTAGGGLWIWMIPVIWGWIMCGTQASAGSISDALGDKKQIAVRIGESGKTEKGVQRGIQSKSGLVPRPRLLESPPKARTTSVATTVFGTGALDESRESGEGKNPHLIEILGLSDGIDGDSITENIGVMSPIFFPATMINRKPLGPFPNFNYKALENQGWLGFSLFGDEAREGPVFNYARLFTFREFSSTTTNAFASYLDTLETSSDNKEERSLVEAAEACKLDRYLQAYTPWQDINATAWQHMVIAAAAAIFVQWGTTGPALMMAYLAPTVGLGCRSGSYLIYGVLGTISFMLLIISFLLSHAVSLRYQDIYEGKLLSKGNADPESAGEEMQMLPNQVSGNTDLSLHVRSTVHCILSFLTVSSRMLGKFIAIINSCWIIVSSIFEYTGVYSSCWCNTDALSLGARGYVVLFLTPENFNTVIKNFWVGGVVFSFGVCGIAYGGFWAGCRRSDGSGGFE